MWTKKQFRTEMKKAGWTLKSQVGTYTHKETGTIFHPFNFVSGEGEAWLQWAELEMTPPTETAVPTPPDINRMVTAIAAALGIDRHELGNVITELQARAIIEESKR